MNNENSKYIPTIGLEIHAELKTQSKMFCNCKNESFVIDTKSNIDHKPYTMNLTPNTNVCPVCLGMPGTLPVINKQAVEWTILTGLALNCKISEFTKWDRKNYFYPDLPKGYQISQYDLPICLQGYLEIPRYKMQDINKFQNAKIKNQNENLKFENKKIRITRIHLEEDTGTSKHPEGREGVNYSLLDYNRAGVPLMELVTEPDISSAEEAKEFCKEYQLILRNLSVSDADMEKGQLRCEVNISLRKNSQPKADPPLAENDKAQMSNQIQNPNVKNQKMGTKVEVKNLNSFKAVERAIKYEIERQTDVLESGEKVVQETRGWDDAKGKTYTMRVKETSADYRYFPEPDLPPIKIGGNSKSEVRNPKQIQNSKSQIININEIKKQMPELPDEKKERYIKEYKLSEKDTNVIIGNVEMMRFFESCIKLTAYDLRLMTKLTNWIINEISDLSVKPEQLVELVNLIEKGEISGKTAKEILPEIIKGKSPSDIIKEKGLKQVSDANELESIVAKVIKENSDVIAKIKAGKTQVIGFLVGQVMKATKGQANPKIVNEIILTNIKERKIL